MWGGLEIFSKEFKKSESVMDFLEGLRFFQVEGIETLLRARRGFFL